MKITFFGNNLKSSRVFSKLNCTKICNQKIAYVLCFLVFIKHNYIKQTNDVTNLLTFFNDNIAIHTSQLIFLHSIL